MTITQERLKELLTYNPKTGFFKWNINRGRAIKGTIAGVILDTGYRQITLDYKPYGAHQLVWLWLYGFISERIDHEDGNPDNNRPLNLRPATQSQNVANKHKTCGVSGYKGIHRNKTNHMWVAQIYLNGKNVYVGQASTPEEAAKLYDKAARRHHGKFACLNFPKRGEQGIFRKVGS